jgi:hypothetical protein
MTTISEKLSAAGYICHHFGKVFFGLCGCAVSVRECVSGTLTVFGSHTFVACHVQWHVGQATMAHIPVGRGFTSSLTYFNFGEFRLCHSKQCLSRTCVGEFFKEGLIPNLNCSSTNVGEDHFTQIRGGQAMFEEEIPAPSNCEGVDLWNTNKPAYGQNGTYGG